MEKQHSGRSSFSGKLGFVLSAAGASVGLGISWISPVGPLKLSYAKPLNAKTGDRLERFQRDNGLSRQAHRNISRA